MEFREYTEIAFAAGDILTVQMLEETYRYPREFLHITHTAYCDGIITGLDFEFREGDVHLTAGIVKHHNRFYIHPYDVNLDEWLRLQPLVGGREYFLCLVNNDDAVTDKLGNGIALRSKIAAKIFPSSEYGDAILLGKFRFDLNKLDVPNLKLEKEVDPFEDFFKSGVLYLLDAQYAHPQGGTTYHPLVFRAIRCYLEQKTPLSPYDFILLTEIQNHGIVAESTLKSYVAVNGNTNLTSIKTREDLFRATIKCLQEPYLPFRERKVTTNIDDTPQKDIGGSALIED